MDLVFFSYFSNIKMHLVEIGKLEKLWENNLLKWNEITM